MADNRKNNTAGPVKKRPLSRKAKKTIRKSLAGVCLLSALIVAAIPSDRSGKASASITSEQKKVFDAINMLNGVDNDGSFYGSTNGGIEKTPIANSGLVYDYDLKNAPEVQKDVNAPDLTLAVPGKVESASTGWIRTIDNNNYLVDMYKYYETSATNNSAQKLGVICDHNKNLGNSYSDLYISNTMCVNYDFYSDTYYENYLQKKYKNYKFVVYDPYGSCYLADINDTNYRNAKTGTVTDIDGNHEVTAKEMADLFPEYTAYQERFETWINSEHIRNKDDTDYCHTYQDLVDVGYDGVWLCNFFTFDDANSAKAFCYHHAPVESKRISQENLTITMANVDNPVDLDKDRPHSDVDAGPISSKIYIFTDKRSVSNRQPGWEELMDQQGRLYSKFVRISAIGNEAFNGNNTISSITLGEGLLYVGDGAFQNCSNLKNVDMKEVSYIGSRVFYNCSALTSVNMYDNLQAIGNEAFASCQNLPKISIPHRVHTIGFGAFSNCTAMSSATVSANVSCKICDYAFYNTENLREVDFTQATTDISLGKACFAMERSGGDGMTSFTFPEKMGQASTYELYGADVDLFGAGSQVKGASTKAVLPEAVDTTSASEMDSLKNKCRYTSIIGDYMFANRRNLMKVYFDVLGISQDERIPMNTFLGCTQLTEVNLKAQDGYREGMLGFDANIFRHVTSTSLCVFGPKNVDLNKTGKPDPSTDNKADYAKPRMSTWACYSFASDYVPYCYEGHYEVGEKMGEDGFLFDLEVGSDRTTAAIASCTYLGNLNDSKTFGTSEEPFCVPANVANMQVTELKRGALDNIKNNILYLEIPDNSLNTLGDNVFESCRKLEGVILGDSVQTIGTECFRECKQLKSISIGDGILSVGDFAFANCEKLEDVYWEQPDNATQSWTDQSRTIGMGAFSTGADFNAGKLYFHGNADSSYYEPFRYAMNPENTINGSVHICYMSPVSGDVSDTNAFPHLTDEERKSRIQTMSMMLYQEAGTSGAPRVMLIDYPRFEELPASIKTLVESGGVDNNTGLSEAEKNLARATVNINVPNVVQSIDVNAFINNNNYSNDVRYIDDSNASKALYGGRSKRQLYGSTSTTSTSGISLFATGTQEVTHPGLFSADVADNLNAIHKKDAAFTETNTRGNDWVETITLPRVEELPDYCFDSCERLLYINLGDKLGQYSSSIGTKVFHGCDSLTQLAADYTNPDGNPYLSFENYVLYRHDAGDTAEELVACLSYRGTDGIGSELSPSGGGDINHLSKVTLIKEGAFDGCTRIKSVDFTDVPGLNELVEDCFNGCKRLISVKLPQTMTWVRSGAFCGCRNGLTVTIPSDRTNIEPDAFDDYDRLEENEYYINSPKDCPAYYYTTEGGGPYFHIHWSQGITVKFYKQADLFELFEGEYAVQNFNTVPVSVLGFPETPSNFDTWAWRKDSNTTLYGEDATHNITEDRNIYAVYKTDPAVEHTVTFYYDNYDVISTKTVADGGNVTVPDFRNLKTQLEERADEVDEWEFSAWRCYKYEPSKNRVADDQIYSEAESITCDWECVATFKRKSSPTVPTPSGGVTPTTPANPTNTPTPTKAPVIPTSTPTPVPSKAPSGSPTPTVSQNSPSENVAGKRFYATVENGSGSGQYPAGSVVTITAYSAPEGRVFDRWTTSNTDIGISNAFAVSATFIMPNHDVKVTATYKSASVSGNTPTPVPGPPDDTTPTPVPRHNDDGSEVRITTDTIENNKKNLGIASVAGSTDNFVVKVTDSAAATAAVESALSNAYGERFHDLKYAAFDISLYDSTGTYIVSNANNLAVTITLPIPESLVPYAGNNKAGAVINGQLQELYVNFTTIDGVPCMRFTATHFSPYVIYVDTQNIVRGITDNTPKTGDGIAPKWFLSAGMLSMSAVLFLWKDKNPVIAGTKKRKKR